MLINTFSNGIFIYEIYTDSEVSKEKIDKINKVANIVFNTPSNELTDYFLDGLIGGR